MATSTARRRKKATVTEDTQKALVSVPSPGRPNRMFVVGRAETGKEVRIDADKRSRHSIYYEMYRQHPTVRAGVEKLAKAATANGYRFVPADEGVQPAESRLADLRTFFRLSNANQLLRLTYKDILIFGEAYWLVLKLGSGTPFAARRLHPMYMDAEVEQGVVTKWRYGPLMQSDDAQEYRLDEVIHFKMDDPNSDIYGLSLLDSLQNTVASDLFAMKFNRKFFENSAHTGVIFNMKNSTPDEVARNREWLDQNYVGADNAHRPVILEGDISVEKSVATAQEMQFIEGRKFNRQEILSVLDIDPTKLGINEDANRSNSKEADNTFLQEAVEPLQAIVEEEVSNALILGMFGYEDILFQQNAVSLRNQLSQMKLFAEGERMGVFSPNDIRAELGRKRVEGGDSYFVQTAAGLIPLELLDDVARRLVTTGGMPQQTGLGTENPPNRPPSRVDPDEANDE